MLRFEYFVVRNEISLVLQWLSISYDLVSINYARVIVNKTNYIKENLIKLIILKRKTKKDKKSTATKIS